MGESSTVKVQLFGGLDRRSSQKDVTEVDAGVGSIAGLLQALGLPEEGVGRTLVNGQYASLTTPLEAGDEVALFPPVG